MEDMLPIQMAREEERRTRDMDGYGLEAAEVDMAMGRVATEDMLMEQVVVPLAILRRSPR